MNKQTDIKTNNVNNFSIIFYMVQIWYHYVHLLVEREQWLVFIFQTTGLGLRRVIFYGSDLVPLHTFIS